MSRAAAARRTRPCATTASYTVHFQKRSRRRTPQHQEPTVGRIPRVTRSLALAHKIHGMIRAGEIKDWAEAARIIRVTRARMTQIANLLLLAPSIQEEIVDLTSLTSGVQSLAEHGLRSIAANAEWCNQKIAWRARPTDQQNSAST